MYEVIVEDLPPLPEVVVLIEVTLTVSLLVYECVGDELGEDSVEPNFESESVYRAAKGPLAALPTPLNFELIVGEELLKPLVPVVLAGASTCLQDKFVPFEKAAPVAPDTLLDLGETKAVVVGV